jgi:SAM-dependent methyltransferase
LKLCLSCEHEFDAPSWRCPRCGNSPATGAFPSFAPELENAGFESEWFGPLAAVESDSFWFRARNRLVLWALGTYFPHARSLFEVGCGTGFVLSAIAAERPNIALTGGDAASEGLRIARERLPDVSLIQVDARRLPFEREFDVAAAFDVLEHVVEDGQVLDQLFRATVPGGGLIVLVPQHPWLWDHHADAGHERRYRRGELAEKVRAAGFAVIRSTSFVSLPLPLMVASRKLGRRDMSDPVAELRAAERVGGILERVLDLELRAIARGVSFPAGGSRLVVARRPR